MTVTPKAEELGWSFFGPLIGRAVAAIETFSHEERETVSAFLTRMREAAADARTELAPDR